MWHRVDYDDDDENCEEEELATSSNNKISIGEYPLFGILIVPNLLKEMLGYNVQ